MRVATLGAIALLSCVSATSLDAKLKGTQFQNVTLASAKVYERLGEKHFQVGMAFQACALFCMFVVACAQVNRKMVRRGLTLFDAVTETKEFAAFLFTVLAYCILDGLYEPTFVGSKLMIFNVNSTCTGMNCTDPYSVIAGGVKQALAESCHHFNVHSTSCTDHALLKALTTFDNDFCKNDPAIVGDIYFVGTSNMALSFAFVVGCFLAFILNVSDVLRFWRQDKVLSGLLAGLKIGELKDDTKWNAILNVEDAAHHKATQEAKNVMRFQTFMRMSMEGLSYGLMMMILEVEIDGDCVAMRAMLPIHIASAWAYTIITVTSFVVVSFFMIGLLNLSQNVTHLKQTLKRFSAAFIVLMGIFVFFAFLAYLYSVVLAIYLAYTVPSDSAVIVGCGLAMLSMASQVAAMYDPQPSDHWDESDDEESEDELEEEDSS